MNPVASDRELLRLQDTLEGASKILTKASLKGTLRVRAEPMMAIAKTEAPASAQGEYIKIRYGGNTTSNDYRRGGAMREDIRVKTVDLQNGDAGVLVGVSKKRGKVGWRAHFITRGTENRRTRRKKANRGRVRKNDFLQRALNRGLTQFVQGVDEDVQKKVKRFMAKVA